MRLFNTKASNSSNSLTAGLRGALSRLGGPAGSRATSARDTFFEPMENRQMFSTTIPIIHPIPLLTNKAITAEYAATAHETDAYGNNVQKLLGSATSLIETVSGVSGAEVEFFHDNGAIYWSAGTGAHVVYGGIGAEYAHLATETDAYGRDVQLLLGLPTSDEMNISGVSGGRHNTFQNGSIDWTASTGAHVVYGQIGGLYNSLGGPTGWLGMPTSDEAGPTNNRVADYQDGYISWSPSGGPVAHETSVTIGTEYGDELVITAKGLRDNVTVSQSGSKLTINANGNIFTDSVPSAGLFVYTRGGMDGVTIGSSVSVRTTVDTIDGAWDVVDSYGSNDFIWADSTDYILGGGSIHKVGSFAGGVSKALGASLANPSDSGTTVKVNSSLFGTGPVATDINQGAAADCYFLAPLAGIAHVNPNIILNSAVDLGDGTYAVEFFKSGTPEYVRVNNSFPVGGFEGLNYAHPGPSGNIWAMVMEKAFCYFRKGANTYLSIGWGSPAETLTDLNISSVTNNPNVFSNSAILFLRLAIDLANGDAVSLCTPGTPPNLVGSHCYTLMSVEDVNNTLEFTVRNPWGVSGDSLENAQGIATLTYSQLLANFNTMTEAT